MTKSTKPKKKEQPVKLNTSFEELFNMSTTYVPKNSVVRGNLLPKSKKKKDTKKNK